MRLSVGRRRALCAAAALAVTAGLVITAVRADAAVGCRIDYTTSQWPGGFNADVAIVNLGDPVDRWTLAWDFAAGQKIQQGWNGTFTQAGQRVTVTNASWNGRIATNGTVRIGFLASWQVSNPRPAAFTLNGVTCTGSIITPTSAGPTSAGPTSAAPTSAGPTTVSPPDPPVDNPYVGAAGYLNPDRVARINTAADAAGGTIGAAMRQVATYPTAVWLDTIASITAGRGLRGHLDAALAQQQSSGTPAVVTLVLQNLPNRSCNLRVMPGELTVAENGLARYKTEFIDPIAAILADAKYKSLRIATVIEPDSLQNLVFTVLTPACAEALQSGAYLQGVQYAINKLDPIANVYPYLDMSNSSVIGWDDNLVPMVQLYAQIAQGTTGGMNSLAGFAVNTASYVPVEEKLLPDPNLNIMGQPVRSSRFFDWNPMFDESDLVAALYPRLVAAGFPTSVGFLIDTSRNGWAGPPLSAVPTLTDVNQYVDAARTDRRLSRVNWCNQAGAGLGARPAASPLPHVDAYVWVKPPGESDGVSDPTLPEYRLMDNMCEPGWTGPSGYKTGALPTAPPRGQWFPAAFTQLVQNAYPPLYAR